MLIGNLSNADMQAVTWPVPYSQTRALTGYTVLESKSKS